MTSKETKKHTKHTALIKPLGGEYHKNEWTIIGAPCSIIHTLADNISQRLSSKYQVGYLDADHQAAETNKAYAVTFTDKISYQQVAFAERPGQKQNRKYFNQLDALIVNGNHFKGDNQIVIIHEKKKESLKKKLDRLTNIRLVILTEENQEVFDYLDDHVGGTPVLQINELDKIISFIETDLKETTVAPLFGLVLAGGKSTRMGKDKGSLEYFGKAHREYLADQLQTFCEKIYVSCRADQLDSIESNYDKLTDTFTGLGPYGAILSAFREQPNKAWLTIACDLPYLNEATIKQLFEARNPSKLATCFHNPETNFPEPLITIWEPRAYPVLLEFLSQGYSCPRKVLINTDIEVTHMFDPLHMLNANDPGTYEQVMKDLRQ